jgi:hypothetical protein
MHTSSYVLGSRAFLFACEPHKTSRFQSLFSSWSVDGNGCSVVDVMLCSLLDVYVAR